MNQRAHQDRPHRSAPPIILEILGPAGAGKSTLIHNLTQRQRPDFIPLSQIDTPRYLRSLRTVPLTPWTLRCHHHAWRYLRHATPDPSLAARTAGPCRAFRRFRHRLALTCRAARHADARLIFTEQGIRDSLAKDLALPDDPAAFAHLEALYRHLRSRLALHILWLQCSPETAHQRARTRAQHSPSRANERAALDTGITFIEQQHRQHQRFIASLRNAGTPVIELNVDQRTAQQVVDQLLDQLNPDMN